MAVLKGILQPAAPGLLSALQLKQRGVNPDALGDVVTPVVDLSHWYLADTPSNIAGTGPLVTATPTVGAIVLSGPTGGTITVPSNEIWWVRSFGVEVLATANPAFDIKQLAPALRYRVVHAIGDSSRLVGESAPPITSTGFAPAGITLYSPCIRDVWAPPGTDFQALFSGVITTAGAIQLRGYVVYDALLI